MQYLNILFDVVFKYLMQDNEIARQILSLILGLEILELEFLAQESARATEIKETGKHLRLLRLDFKAVIRTTDGQLKHVLIELQKDKKPTVSWRFRQYLAGIYEYKPGESELNMENPIPTIAVYLLGYPVFEKKYPFVRSRIQYESGLNNELLPNLKIPNFVSGLSHECVYIHVNGFKNQPSHPITDLMHMFDQSRKHKDNAEVLIANKLPNPGSLPDLILKRMHNAMNDKALRQAALEEHFDELDLRITAEERDMERNQKDEAIRQKEEAISQKQEERRQKEEERGQKEEERRQKEEERRQKEEILSNSIRLLHRLGLSSQQIADELKIDLDTVEQQID
jgi:hypothetical protein